MKQCTGPPHPPPSTNGIFPVPGLGPRHGTSRHPRKGEASNPLELFERTPSNGKKPVRWAQPVRLSSRWSYSSPISALLARILQHCDLSLYQCVRLQADRYLDGQLQNEYITPAFGNPNTPQHSLNAIGRLFYCPRGRSERFTKHPSLPPCAGQSMQLKSQEGLTKAKCDAHHQVCDQTLKPHVVATCAPHDDYSVA
jgi:hypothetical protein